MLKITKPAANRVDIDLSGKIDAETMRMLLDDLIEKCEDVVNGRMLYTISDFAMPTVGALGVELTRLPKLFGLLARFDRCAVVSEAGWIRTAAEVEGALFPFIEIKSFEPHEMEKAQAWLAQGAAGGEKG